MKLINICILFVLALFLSVSIGSAWTNNTFYNGTAYSSSSNITFVGNQNVSVNISIPSSVTLLNIGRFNLTGLFGTPLTNIVEIRAIGNTTGSPNLQVYEIEVWNSTSKITASSVKCIPTGTNCNNIIDGNYGSPYDAGAETDAWINITLNNNYSVQEVRLYKIYTATGATTIYPVNVSTFDYPSNSFKFFGNMTITDSSKSRNISGVSANTTIKLDLGGNGYDFTYSVNNGTGSTYSTFMLNLLTYINSYLPTCSIAGGYCQVPLIFNSQSGGVVQYDNIVLDDTGAIINLETYTASVFETTSSTFTLNLTLGSGASLSTAILNYGGTNYSANVATIGGNVILTREIDAPTVTTSTNYSFYWYYVLTGVGYTTTIKNQSVLNLGIDDCSVNSVQVINYTIYDEDARTLLSAPANNITAEVLIKLSGSFDGNNYNYYANTSGSNPIRICISSALVTGQNYRLDADIKYSTTDHVTEYYILENVTINTTSIPIGINLYDLLITSSQEFLITFKDNNFIAVPGALIELTRQYLSLGQFLPVEIARTDIDGRTIGHFVLNDEVYTINVRKGGQLLATYQNIRVYCTTGDCRLNLNQPGATTSPDNFKNRYGVTYSTSYNSTSRLYSLQFSSTDGTSKVMNLTTIQFDNYLNNTICSNQLDSFSGTLTCTIPANVNGTILVVGKVDDLLLFQEFISSESRNTQSSPWGYLLAVVLVLTLVLMAGGNPIIALVGFVVGMIFAGIFGFINWGAIGIAGALTWLIIAVLIVIWKANRSENGQL